MKTGKRRSNGGFSLVEIAAVIVIMTLLVVSAGLAGGYFRVLKRERVRGACNRLRNWLVRARAVCMVRGRDMVLTYDFEQNRVEIAPPARPGGEEAEEDTAVRVSFDRSVRIREVSLDPYRTYVNGRVSVEIRRDGWTTPHLVYLGPAGEEEEADDGGVFTVEVFPLGGRVNVFAERRGWDDLR